MIVLSCQRLSKSFGVNHVLEDVSFVLQEGQRLGLVGVNGSGKSTLLRILTGELHQDSGELSIQKGSRLGYLAQSWRPQKGRTVYQEMEAVFDPVFAMEKKMAELEKAMSQETDEEMLRRIGNEYADTMHRYESVDGYACRSLVQGVLVGLGFVGERQQQEAQSLSGGELTRLSLGRLLLQKPDILLVDEPTNHLDLSALKWLEEYLSNYQGAVIVVSHDRYFLDRVCTDMVEIVMGRSEQYKGNYSRYMEQRVERFESRRRAYERQQDEIARQEAIIERYRSFNREKSIRAAESREKKLEKMERLERPTEEKQITFRFEAKRRMGEDALQVKNLSKAYGETRLFAGADLDMKSGERVMLIGSNGIGKTTFIECLLGEKQADTGLVDFGANADIGYYDQKQQHLHGAKTVMDEVWDEFPRLTQTEVRSALGLFLFSGDDAFKRIETLSGGEKARVALTKLMLRKDNFLLLDEPTNHLDADSREMLETALDGFEGTLLCVSHDRYFINRLATRVIEMRFDGIASYEGNYDDYLAMKQREEAGLAETENGGLTRTEQAKMRKRSRAEQERYQLLKDAAAQAEKNVVRLEEEKTNLEALMALPEVYADPRRAQETAEQYRRIQKEIEDAYALWEETEAALL